MIAFIIWQVYHLFELNHGKEIIIMECTIVWYCIKSTITSNSYWHLLSLFTNLLVHVYCHDNISYSISGNSYLIISTGSEQPYMCLCQLDSC